MPGLRAITMTARLRCAVTLCRTFSNRCDDPMLRVLAGLLVNIIVGSSVSVWVIVMCRCRLLSTLRGPRLRWPLTFSLCVTLCTVRWLGRSLCSANGSLTPRLVARHGSRPKLRKTNLTWLCCRLDSVLLESAETLALLTTIWLEAGVLNLVSKRSNAAPFDFDGFMTVANSFPLNWVATFVIVIALVMLELHAPCMLSALMVVGHVLKLSPVFYALATLVFLRRALTALATDS